MFAIRKKKDRLGVINGYLWVYGTDYAHSYVRSDGKTSFAQFTSRDKAETFATYDEAVSYFNQHHCSDKCYEIILVTLFPAPWFGFWLNNEGDKYDPPKT